MWKRGAVTHPELPPAVSPPGRGLKKGQADLKEKRGDLFTVCGECFCFFTVRMCRWTLRCAVRSIRTVFLSPYCSTLELKHHQFIRRRTWAASCELGHSVPAHLGASRFMSRIFFALKLLLNSSDLVKSYSRAPQTSKLWTFKVWPAELHVIIISDPKEPRVEPASLSHLDSCSTFHNFSLLCISVVLSHL